MPAQFRMTPLKGHVQYKSLLRMKLVALVLSCYQLARLLLRRLWSKPETIVNSEKLAFLDGYRCYYGYPDGPSSIDQLRMSGFARLNGVVYLDHAGATLHSDSQLEAVMRDCSSQLYGNPHSQNQSSTRTSEIVESARLQVLAFFKASPSDYACVFTSGATAGLKLIGETFPWTSESEFHYTTENHNSVLGIREYALAQGATATAFDIEEYGFTQRASQKRNLQNAGLRKDGCSLFAMPSECNFSGMKLNLDIVRTVQERKHVKNARGRWMVLLDAAKSAGTSPPDLSRTPADFVVASFYKIFGFPTGLGALIIRRDAGEILEKKYFGGGTVSVSIAHIDFIKKRERLEQWLEDGTVSFLSIVALLHGFSAIERLGINNIARHTWSLTHYTASKLLQLSHANGAPVCCIYGNHGMSEDFHDAFRLQGPVVTFNLKRADGSWIGYREVEKLAALSGIHLRTGCFCNPGACAKHLELSAEDMQSNYEAGHTCWDDHDLMSGRPTGAIRISFGYMSTFEDCQKLLRFLRKFFVEDKIHCLKQVKTSVTNQPVRLKSIYVYPIKSCGGFKADSWPVTDSGLLYDREWLIVDSGNVALTQKRVRSICLIKPVIDLASRTLIVSAPSMKESLQISLQLNELLDSSAEFLQSAESKTAISEWFTKAIGVPCTLIRKDVRSAHACRWRNPGDDAGRSFANEGQFLLVSDSSLTDLNSRVASSKLRLDPMQFRPNLVVSGAAAYDEDNWRSLRIGDTQLPVIGGCNRCQMITINQETGESHANSEPLVTLAAYRRTKGKVLFGALLGEPSSGRDAILTVGSLISVNYL